MGSTYTPADLVKLVQSRTDSATQTTTTKATWHSTVAAQRTLSTQVAPILRDLRRYVIGLFGPTSPVLADFGFSPPKQATRTPEQKAAAAAKAKATRAVRHTMGKKQKKAVKGDVTGIIVTPVTAQMASIPGAPVAPSGASGPPTAPAAPIGAPASTVAPPAAKSAG
jgi:hypothetical protein